MPEISSDKYLLISKIEKAFPFIDMPKSSDLALHNEDCQYCHYLQSDLEAYRNKDFTSSIIRMLHQEMSHLSGSALCWLLPHYLRFCMTPEAEYNQTETEYLIYHFSPNIEFQKTSALQFSLLNKEKIDCLIEFFEYFLNQEYWKEYYLEDIQRAINFLKCL